MYFKGAIGVTPLYDDGTPPFDANYPPAPKDLMIEEFMPI